MTQFRVMTYNVRALRDDRDALVHVIRSADPDVLCVQEAPRFFRWRSKCAALARDCDLVYVNGGGTTGGAALFAHLRVHVEAQREGRLSKTSGMHQRAVAAAVVSKSGSRLMVLSTHLGLRAPERARHARELLAGLAWHETRSLVVAGDLNSGPKSEVWQVLHEGGLRDPDPRSGPTFPAWEPVKRIDALLVSADVEVTDYRVVSTPGVERATDHRPVLAVVEV
jgi:endonuclease/exonuclease/phosphatase family metal-dependent hydrolase